VRDPAASRAARDEPADGRDRSEVGVILAKLEVEPLRRAIRWLAAPGVASVPSEFLLRV
jgi:hypothetical protein